jgi:hypothetical protein
MKENMMVRKIEIERFSVTSSKPFAAVVGAIKASVGQPNMVEFAKQPGPQGPSLN